MPELRHVGAGVWALLETLCTAIFTAEYVLRFLVCDVAGVKKMQFVKDPLNVFDLIAIAPFYIQLAFSMVEDARALRILRAVRLIRLFRIFKLSRYSSGMRMMAEAIRDSVQALWVLIFILSIGIILFSSMIYYVEKMECPARETLDKAAVEQYLLECVTSSSGFSETYGLCCDDYDSPLMFPSITHTF